MNGKINTAKSMGLIWIKFSYNMFSIIFSLKGVLMHYEGIEILSKKGIIKGTNVYWNVSATCFVFSSQKGAILIGKINK